MAEYDNYLANQGDQRTAVGLRKHLVRRLRGMRAQRGGVEPLWQEIARFSQATTNRYIAAYANGSRSNYDGIVNLGVADTINTKLMSSRAVWASDTLANGMYSGLTSAARPWFKTTVADREMREFQSTKEWLDIVEGLIYELLSKTNFYTTAKSGFNELGVFGTEAGFMERHWRYGMVAHPLVAGEYWLGLDDGLVPDSLYRRCDMTTMQHYQKFAAERLADGKRAIDILPRRVVESYDKGDYDLTFPVFHAAEPNTTRESGRLDYRGKRWRSVYWSGACEEAEGTVEEKALLLQQGFNTKPFWAARWEAKGADVYGSMSPGLRALADTRQLQLQVLRKQQAIDFGVKPALHGPATLNNMNVALQPGRITAMANIDKDSFGAIWEVRGDMIREIANDTELTMQAVDRGFYADLFNAITNMPGVQPRNVEELAQRNEEKLTQLGPVVERVHQEKLKVVIERAYDILKTAGMLPPPPPELDGVEIEIEFISILAQAQRLVGLGSIERTYGFVASADPDGTKGMWDALDSDAAITEYADIVSLPAKILRAQDKRDELRNQRQEAQAAAAQAEQMATMAPAAKAGAEAAQILYDSPGIGDTPTLADRLLGTN